MILRVPDFYDEFSCIADRCKGSCCAGWEIDIDEPTREYYMGVPGEIGDRMREKLYHSEDGDYRFCLSEDGRCPFLNSDNLCDIIIALGPEALSEVCTDFPRFALSYGHVMQRVLSISCEEVGRILFSRKEPLAFVEHSMDGCMADWEDDEADEAYIAFLEQIQKRAIALLQDRREALAERVAKFLGLCESAQEVINAYSESQDPSVLEEFANRMEQISPVEMLRVRELRSGGDVDELYEAFDVRMYIFEELEELGLEWVETKKRMREVLTAESYADKRAAYMASDSYDEIAYEHLLVYFTFRYLMQAVYSWDLLAYAKMIVTFTLMIRDLDIARWSDNGGQLGLDDRIDTAHIFSREVEHSEENFEQIREELMFE